MRRAVAGSASKGRGEIRAAGVERGCKSRRESGNDRRGQRANPTARNAHSRQTATGLAAGSRAAARSRSSGDEQCRETSVLPREPRSPSAAARRGAARLTPSASRMPISRRRCSPRASRRLATFAHAISRMANATAASRVAIFLRSRRKLGGIICFSDPNVAIVVDVSREIHRPLPHRRSRSGLQGSGIARASRCADRRCG